MVYLAPPICTILDQGLSLETSFPPAYQVIPEEERTQGRDQKQVAEEGRQVLEWTAEGHVATLSASNGRDLMLRIADRESGRQLEVEMKPTTGQSARWTFAASDRMVAYRSPQSKPNTDKPWGPCDKADLTPGLG